MDDEAPTETPIPPAPVLRFRLWSQGINWSGWIAISAIAAWASVQVTHNLAGQKTDLTVSVGISVGLAVTGSGAWIVSLVHSSQTRRRNRELAARNRVLEAELAQYKRNAQTPQTLPFQPEA
jgi:hypothetical protein